MSDFRGYPSLQDLASLDNDDLKEQLNKAEELPPIHNCTKDELTNLFKSEPLRTLARHIRQTKVWIGQARKSEVAHFITTGFAGFDASDRLDEAEDGNYHGFRPQYGEQSIDVDPDNVRDSPPSYDGKSDNSSDSTESENSNNSRQNSNGETEGPIEQMIIDLVDQHSSVSEDVVDQKINDQMDEAIDQIVDLVDASPDPIRIETVEDGEIKDMGVQHERFEALLRMLELDLIPYLEGPPGSGKSTAAEMVAEARGAERFESMSCSRDMSKYDLIGIMNPQSGEFEPTGFTECLLHGGDFLLDELDRAPGSVVVFLNSLLANGFINLPGKGRVKVHKDFALIAAGNTAMRGKSKRYRATAQDVATIDRFTWLKWPRDRAMECALAGVNPDTVGVDGQDFHLHEPGDLAKSTRAEWTDYCFAVRDAFEALDQPYESSYRAIENGLLLLKNGFSRHVTEEATLWKGMSDDVKERVKNRADEYRTLG